MPGTSDETVITKTMEGMSVISRSSNKLDDTYDVMTDQYQVITVRRRAMDTPIPESELWRTRIFLNHAITWDASLLADVFGSTKRESVHKAVVQARKDEIRKERLWIAIDKIEEHRRLHPHG